MRQSVQPSNPVHTHQTRGDSDPSNPIAKPAQSADAVLPAADLKPLYDFAMDCKACQAKLAASQSDLNDEKVKTAALTKERDAAIRTAKGGSALRRIARAAKWLVLGAAAGAIAAEISTMKQDTQRVPPSASFRFLGQDRQRALINFPKPFAFNPLHQLQPNRQARRLAHPPRQPALPCKEPIIIRRGTPSNRWKSPK